MPMTSIRLVASIVKFSVAKSSLNAAVPVVAVWVSTELLVKLVLFEITRTPDTYSLLFEIF